jgi:hypothetical protein
MVSFEVDRLPVQPASALGPTECPPIPPYGGRRTLTCVGPAGELIELIETGAVGAEIELRVERPQPGA